jgi:hypothetical protein
MVTHVMPSAATTTLFRRVDMPDPRTGQQAKADLVDVARARLRRDDARLLHHAGPLALKGQQRRPPNEVPSGIGGSNSSLDARALSTEVSAWPRLLGKNGDSPLRTVMEGVGSRPALQDSLAIRRP